MKEFALKYIASVIIHAQFGFPAHLVLFQVRDSRVGVKPWAKPYEAFAASNHPKPS